MLRLHDIMTRELVTLSPQHSVREAMSILTSHHITGAPVLSSGKVVGVVSLTDLAETASSAPGVPTQRDGEDESFDWDDSVPLPEETAPGDYFHQFWDDAGADVSERIADTDGPEWDALQDHTVGEAMTRKVHALPPGTTVPAAAQFMKDAAIHRVLVMERDALLGVVTTKDISDAVAEHRLTVQTYVFGRSGLA